MFFQQSRNDDLDEVIYYFLCVTYWIHRQFQNNFTEIKTNYCKQNMYSLLGNKHIRCNLWKNSSSSQLFVRVLGIYYYKNSANLKSYEW